MALQSRILNPNPIYVNNQDLRINNQVVLNNNNANRSMLRAHRARLDKNNKKRVNAQSYETYGDVTPHDKFGVGSIIHDWQYGAKELSQSADNTKKNRSTTFRPRKASARDYNREFTKTVNEPFKFKIGYQNQSDRLDAMDSNFLHKNIDNMQGKDKYLVRTQQMLHGDQNTYFPGMPETLRSNSIHRSTTQREHQRIQNKVGQGTIRDQYVMELEKDNNVYDSNNNQLKRRINAPTNYPKSLLKQIKTHENGGIMRANEKTNAFDEFEATQNGYNDPVHEDVKFNNFCTTNESFNKSNASFFPHLEGPESSKYGSFYASRTSGTTLDRKWVPSMNNKMQGVKTPTGDDFYKTGMTSNRLRGLGNLDNIMKNSNTKGAYANQTISGNRWNVENKNIAKGPNFKRFVNNGEFSKTKSPFGETRTQFMHGIPKNGMGDTGMSIGRVPFQIQRNHS